MKRELGYYYPVKGFGKPKFRAQSKIELLKIQKQLRENTKHLKIRKTYSWTYVCAKRQKKSKKINFSWRPKLYICASSACYWKAIFSLIKTTHQLQLDWKFCQRLSLLGRPDKIIIYFESETHLKKSLPKIRCVLKTLRSHSLSHAGSTLRMGLETQGRGFYIGADPVFLKQMSWRLYRCIVLAAMEHNFDYFQEEASKMKVHPLEAFNLSLHHQGPRSFKSSPAQLSYIQNIFKKII